MLKCFRQKGLIKARGRARSDSTHVLAAIQQLNRIECVAETLRHVLNELATVAPEWLSKQVSRDWFDRYSYRLEQSRLPPTKQEQQQLALAFLKLSVPSGYDNLVTSVWRRLICNTSLQPQLST
jgi:transposase